MAENNPQAPKPQTFLEQVGLDPEFVKKEVIQPMVKDYAMKTIKDQLGIKTESNLRKGSRAYHLSTFVKEVGWQLIGMAGVLLVMIIAFRVLTRWLGV